ncbi:hypothetical protein RB595_006330 [Gaeumannomyces hyphopodioides]
MPWTEQSPGHWQRPLGENERFIKWIGDQAIPTGREHWSVTIVGTFTLEGSPQKSPEWDGARLARRAWIYLRFRHPSIAAIGSKDGDFLEYVVPRDTAAAEAWAAETFFVVGESQHASASDLISTLRPSAYATCYFLPHIGQVVLHTSHWRTDGYGGLHLLDAYFAAVADAAARAPGEPLPPFGDEPARLTLPIEEVLRLPDEPTPSILAAADALALAARSLVPGSVGLPVRDTGSPGTMQPGGTRLLRSTIPADATRKIMQACTEHGMGWLAAVHASLATVNFTAAASTVTEHHNRRHYTSTIRLGLRPYLPEEYGGPASAASLYTGGYFVKVEPTASWLNNARFYDGLYKKGATLEFLQARRHYATMALQGLQRAAAAAVAPSRSEVDISSVGDAGSIVRAVHSRPGEEGGGGVRVEVKELCLGVECLQRESYLFVWLFRDQLELSLAYNEAFYEEPFMEGVLARVAVVLQAELGVIDV